MPSRENEVVRVGLNPIWPVSLQEEGDLESHTRKRHHEKTQVPQGRWP